MSDAVRAATFVALTSLGAVTAVLVTACGSIALTLALQALLAFILRVIATVGEIGIAVIAAISSGFTISLTVILAASTSAISFPPSRIQARLVVSVAVATASIFMSAMALVTMTSMHVALELGVAVVTSAAFAVAFASAWAVGVMSLVERETEEVGLRMTSLLQAVRHNKYHVLNLLVRLPFGRTPGESDTALLYAVKAGFIECVRVLITAGANPNVQDAYDSTPLISACQLGSVPLVNILLEAGAIVNFRNGSRESAVHQAAKYGHETCTRILIKAGADPGAQDALWRTPLMLAIKHARSPHGIIKVLLDAGCYVNATGTEHRTALHYAAMRGIDIKALLKAGADFDIQDAEGNTALHIAATEGNADVVTSLLEARAASNVNNYVRRTPLHLAAGKGSLACVKTLIAHDSDPIALDSSGYMPICHAVAGNREAAVMHFITLNYFPDAFEDALSLSSPSIRPVSPLRLALERRHFHLAHALALAGCNTAPLRERHLMSERAIFVSDAQTVHYAWVHTCLTEPWNLSDLCRRVIRRRLRRPEQDIQYLPLPNQILDFVMLKDLEEIVSATLPERTST